MEIEIQDEMSFLPRNCYKTILTIPSLRSYDNMQKRRVTEFKHGIEHDTKHGTRKYSYTRPRIILDKNFQDLLGRYYLTFKSRATYKRIALGEEKERKEGSCIVLFFPDEETQEERTESL